jgi:hypothetical protein
MQCCSSTPTSHNEHQQAQALAQLEMQAGQEASASFAALHSQQHLGGTVTLHTAHMPCALNRGTTVTAMHWTGTALHCQYANIYWPLCIGPISTTPCIHAPGMVRQQATDMCVVNFASEVCLEKPGLDWAHIPQHWPVLHMAAVVQPWLYVAPPFGGSMQCMRQIPQRSCALQQQP